MLIKNLGVMESSIFFIGRAYFKLVWVLLFCKHCLFYLTVILASGLELYLVYHINPDNILF